MEEQEGAALVAVGRQIGLVEEGRAVQLGLELPGGGQLLWKLIVQGSGFSAWFP